MITLHDAFIGNYPISQVFGHELYPPPGGYYHQFGFNGHEGLDFALPNGVPVIASVAGVVLHAGPEAGWEAYGTFVEVWDDVQRVAVLYAHLSTSAVRKGQRVWLGQLLGFSDNSGHSSGPHLHFGTCLTDAQGNRQNMNNGWHGWVNPAGPLFQWQITNPKTPVPAPPVYVPVPPVTPLPPKPIPPTPPPPQVTPTLEEQLAAVAAERDLLKQALQVANGKLAIQAGQIVLLTKKVDALTPQLAPDPSDATGFLAWLRGVFTKK